MNRPTLNEWIRIVGDAAQDGIAYHAIKRIAVAVYDVVRDDANDVETTP